MSTTKQAKARFDARLSKRQKEIFEKAALLGGYRNLTDFVILTVQERAKEIIEEHERVIASKRDSDIFFEAILNPPKPNKALRQAAKEYNALFKK